MNLLCIVIGLFRIPQISSQTCLFENTWTIDEYTLDLYAFQAMGINTTVQDQQQYTYTFSPVNNIASWAMIRQFDKTGAMTDLSANVTNTTYKPTISFNKYNNIVWKIDYSPNVTIEYICDPDLVFNNPPYMQFTDILNGA